MYPTKNYNSNTDSIGTFGERAELVVQTTTTSRGSSNHRIRISPDLFKQQTINSE